MKILITGTSGFVGNELRSYFMNKGHDVTGTVGRKAPREGEVKIDLARWSSFQELENQQFDIIIHSAAALEGSSRKVMNEVNVEGTVNVLKLAAQSRCNHFIHISSLAVYGLKALGEDRTEETRRSSKGSSYGATKKRAEEIVEQSNINYSILRLPVVIGKMDSFISPLLIRSLKENRAFYNCGKERKISLLHVQNLPFIVEKMINTGSRNDYYNCLDFNISWTDFVIEYAENTGTVPRFIRRNFLHSFIRSIRDSEKRFTTLVGHKGMHYENGKLVKHLNIKKFPNSWKGAVHDACLSLNVTNSVFDLFLI